jgi:hypothetical protein
MARALIASGLFALVLLAMAPSAMAMGPSAPFVGPDASTPDANDPSLGNPATKGLTGIKLGRKPHALIDGEWRSQGATVREDAVLVAIERQAVQLRHADGTIERLALSPGVEMYRSSRTSPSPTRMP